MQIVLRHNDAKIPERADSGAAGYDLFSCDEYTIPPWSRQLVSTGIALHIPESYYGRLASRSSMGVKCTDIGAGVIDSSYRGEIKVLLINSADCAFKVCKYDKIAQIIFEKCYEFDFLVVQELEKTKRGEQGFGSSDMSK